MTQSLTDVKWRLPDWLGGHVVNAIIFNSPIAGWMVVESPEHGQVAVPIESLTEIKPPSIDDPVKFPLVFVDPEDDQILEVGDEPRGGNGLLFWCRDPDRDEPEGGRSVFVTGAENLRNIARLAWQRANAIEDGAA